MNIDLLGIELAKRIFQLHGADVRGRAVYRARWILRTVGIATSRRSDHGHTFASNQERRAGRVRVLGTKYGNRDHGAAGHSVPTRDPHSDAGSEFGDQH